MLRYGIGSISSYQIRVQWSRTLAHPPTTYITFTTLTHSVFFTFRLGSKFRRTLPFALVRNFRTVLEVVAVPGLTLYIACTLLAVRDESETNFALVRSTVIAFAIIIQATLGTISAFADTNIPLHF